MQASGVGGELRRAWHIAATLGAWRISISGASWHLTADVATANAAWIDHRPLDVIVRLGRITWKWREVTPTIEDGKVSLTLTRRPDAISEAEAIGEA